jgi:hypothetical protein
MPEKDFHLSDQTQLTVTLARPVVAGARSDKKRHHADAIPFGTLVMT